jgi:hypothetical protein
VLKVAHAPPFDELITQSENGPTVQTYSLNDVMSGCCSKRERPLKENGIGQVGWVIGWGGGGLHLKLTGILGCKVGECGVPAKTRR